MFSKFVNWFLGKDNKVQYASGSYSLPKQWNIPRRDALIEGSQLDLVTRDRDWWFSPLSAVVGYTNEDFIYCDLRKDHHALIAGACGSGKSVCINTMVYSLLLKNSPNTLNLYFIDPKMSDYIEFADLPHTMGYADNMESAIDTLRKVQAIMQYRNKMRQEARVKNMWDLPNAGQFPSIVVVFDEFASMMTSKGKKELMELVQDIAQVGRAADIHLILATQYPTSSILTGSLKSNLNGKICFKLQTKVQSRTVLECNGAEMLKGNGDGLYLSSNGDFTHIQGALVQTDQANKILEYWKKQIA